MKWTAIVVSIKNGHFSHSFSFNGPHSKQEAFWKAQELVMPHFWTDVIAIIPGEHAAYHPETE